MLGVSIFFCLAINIFNQLTIEKAFLNKEWNTYKLNYNLNFSEEEDVERKETFLANYQFIVDTNAKNLNFTLKMNEFGHLKKNERPSLLMYQKALKAFKEESPVFIGRSVPMKKDWREDGVVSYVKDQHKCASGYAFSAVGAFESAIAIRTGVVPDLSEQEIVSCSKKVWK
uniref:Cathepsin J (Trinotate prediction) n=1 Tax=Myxobolus squamalis TaxID=59785 RepID=A0A6B2G6S0_MYXSQ